MSTTATTGAQQASFENSIDARSEPLLAEHRIGERCVLPAAAQIDMALSAYGLLVPDREITLGKVSFQAPIEAPGEGSVDVRLVVDASGCQLRSRPHAGEEWHNAMQATMESRPLSAPVYRSVVGLHARCPRSVAPERVREWYQVCGITYGPTYRTLRTLALGTNSALALLSPTMPVSSSAPHRVHPSILDGAFQVLAAGLLVESGALRPAAAIFMPWYLRAVLSPRPFQGPVWCAVEWEDPTGAGELVTGNCALVSQQGEVLLELQGMALKRVPEREGMRAATVPAIQPRPSSPHRQLDASSPPVDLLPETDAAQMIWASGWVPVGTGAPGQLPGGLWVIFADTAGHADLAATTLADHGATVVHVIPGETFTHPDPTTYTIPPTDPHAYHQLLATLPGAITGIIHLWACDHPGHARTPASLDAALDSAVHSPRLLTQALATRQRHVNLWLVTHGATPTHTTDPDLSPAQAALWGLGRVLRIEHPGWHVHLRDLPPGPVATTQTALLHELAQPHPPAELAIRPPQRLQPTLVHRPPNPDPNHHLIRPNGHYLILGGIGGIGLHLAARLSAAGAKTLTLISRRLPDPSQTATLQTLQTRGVRIHHHPADITDPDALARAITTAETRAGPIHGAIHAAGVLKDGLLRTQPTHDAATVLAPKTHGSWALAAALSNRPVDFVVLCTSISGILGNLGQSAYAAANTYQDTLAARQHTHAHPWTSIAWGPWHHTGMAAYTTDQLQQRGIEPIPPTRALALFDIAMSYRTDQLIIAPPEALAVATEPLVPSAAAAPAAPADRSPTPQQQLQQQLADTFRKALRVEHISPDDDVLELGLDSMMAVEVASSLARLGFEIDPPLLFQLPTIARLTDHLLPSREPPESQQTLIVAPPAPPSPAPLVAPSEPRTFLERRLAAMNEDDYALRDRGDYLFEPVLSTARGGWIETGGRRLLNFASYSYLDLIGHPFITQCAAEALECFGTGTHGVRLLAGTMTLHRELEQTIAAFKGTEDAVAFSSGYMANLATIAALVGSGDYVIGDVFNHASIVDGCLLSGATFLQFAHNDLGDLERCLVKAGSAGKLVVVDAVFSMDGDVIDLPGVVHLCRRYDAALMVDEAHSLGVLGATGHGIEEHFGLPSTSVPIKMGTLSKTIPSAGGYVAGSKDLVFGLKHGARGFMFSAATTPAQTAAAKAAFEIMAASPERTQRLAANTRSYRERLHALGFDTLHSETAVVPIICRSAQQAYDFARICQHRGLFVQPIVYPAVPNTTPRLRTIVTAGHTEQDLDTAIDLLAEAGREVGLIRRSSPGIEGIQRVFRDSL